MAVSMLNWPMHLPQLRAQRKVFGSEPFHSKPGVLAVARFWLVLLVVILSINFSSAQNKSLKLDGKGSYVELPLDIFKDLTQATVEVWAKWDGLLNYSRIFEFGGPWQSMSVFNHGGTPDLRFNLYPLNSKYDTSLAYKIVVPGLIRTNEWIHLAAVSGVRGMKLYANGVLVGQHTNTACFADILVSQTNLLGRGLVQNPTDRDFHGEMDELRVWNHRRTSGQIREFMFKRLTGKEKGLAHLWNFDDGTARDVSPSAQHGKLMGNARVENTDIALGATMPVASASHAISNPPPIIASALPGRDSNPAAWWIAGALFALVGLLGWLVMMLRRSGVGSAQLLSATKTRALTAGDVAPAGTANSTQQEIRERALAELTDFAKQSLVQGLYSQRAALLEIHKKAQQELAELETRVVALHLPDRIQAYEKRIAELESQLETRGDELRELTHATLQVLRQKLEEEKQKQEKPSRFN